MAQIGLHIGTSDLPPEKQARDTTSAAIIANLEAVLADIDGQTARTPYEVWKLTADRHAVEIQLLYYRAINDNAKQQTK